MANVYGMIHIVAAALRLNWDITNLPTIPTQNTDQLLLGLCFFIGRWTLQTNVCGVGSDEAGCHWDLSYM